MGVIGMLQSANWKKYVLNALGVFYIFFGILAIWNAYDIGNYSGMLWFCYISLILLGVGMLMRNGYLIASQINILAVPLLMWNIDFLGILFFDREVFHIATYFFEREFFSLANIISLEHLFLLPLALFALWIVGLKRRDAWKLSVVQSLFILFLTLLLTNSEKNINCAFESCFTFLGNFLYIYILIILFACIIILTNILLVWLFYNGKRLNKLKLGLYEK